MGTCKNCGASLDEHDKFCRKCGTQVESYESARKQEYAGKIKKCPYCGEILEAFTANCPSCGREIRDNLNSFAIREFASKLENAKTRNEKITIIRNYPIPNNKEDIFEFLILASSNLSKNKDNGISKAWESKVEQAYQKAKIIFENNKEFERITDIYNQVEKKLKRARKIETANSLFSEATANLSNVVIVFGWLLSIFILIPLCGLNMVGSEFVPYRIVLMIDFIIGVILMPYVVKCESVIPKLLISSGLILTIILLILNCRKDYVLCGYQVYLIVDLVCSTLIFKKIFSNKIKNKSLNKNSFIFTVLCLFVYLCSYIFVDFLSSKSNSILDLNSPVITEDVETKSELGIYNYEIRNYKGKNVASIGREFGGYQIDEYGSGSLKIIFVTEKGTVIPFNNTEFKKQYKVTSQNIRPGTKLTLVHQKDSKGEPYGSLVDYQSYDEIVLYVKPIHSDSKYEPNYIEILPTLDKHKYHIRDYKGRNAASFGKEWGGTRIDEYGHGKLKISFQTEDGTYIDSNNLNILKTYIVVDQDLDPNTDLNFEYEIDSSGNEYNSLIRTQNYDEITLIVKKLNPSLISKFPLFD